MRQLLLLFLYWISILSISAFLPSSEYHALFDLFNSTGGEHWHWFEPWTDYGYPWNFTITITGKLNETANNPCSLSKPWQGITCSTECSANAATANCHVIELKLWLHGLIGTLPPSISNLTHLEILDLSRNFLYDIPPWNTITSSFQYLRNMSFGRNFFHGTIPQSIGQLTNLQELVLERNFFHGPIPDNIGYQLTNLKYLSLSRNKFNSTIPQSLCLLINLQHLELFKNDVTGTIPSCFGSMTDLNSLILNHNYLTGTIPVSLGNLTNLWYLDLAVNSLTGNIPSTLQNLTQLMFLDLDTNQLDGTFPHWMCNMINLEHLDLNSNYFEGTIPTNISQLIHMRYIDLVFNQYTGIIPNVFSNWSVLHQFYLNDNLFIGSLPSSLGDCHQLIIIYLYDNQLTGTIPESYGNLPLFTLFLYNNQLSGTIPEGFINLKYLRQLYVHNNQLTGSIPFFINNPEITLINFNIQNNYFTGKILNSLNFSICRQFITSSNLLHGKFPLIDDGTILFPKLEFLDLSGNMFSGSLPSDSLFGNNSLQVLYINENQFTGNIPSSLFVSDSLAFAVLSLNCFSGTLPTEICHAKSLQQLIFDGLHSASSCVTKAIPFVEQSGLVVFGGVHGHVPSCLFELPYLLVLHLGGNSLSGTIADVDKQNINGKRNTYSMSLVEFVVSGNRISGTIPDMLWNSNITSLDLSLNHFHGTIPNNILPAMSKSMMEGSDQNQNSTAISLKLHDNKLSGNIPSVLWNMPNINVLDGNMFTCNALRSDLPKSDPSCYSYNCGSEQTNLAFTAFATVTGATLLSIWLLPLLLLKFRNRRMSPRNEGYKSLFGILYEWWNLYVITTQRNLNDAHHDVSAGDTTKSVDIEMWLRWIGTVNLQIGCIVIFCNLLVFSILHLSYSTYSYTYFWAVSSIYIQGIAPATLLFLLFVAMLVFILFKVVPFLKPIGGTSCCVSSKLPDISSESADNNKITLQTRMRKSRTASFSTTVGAITWKQYIWATVVFCLNIVVVSCVNGSFIFAVRSGYSFNHLLMISFGLSLFKVVWNYAMLGGWESETLQQYEAKLTDEAILWLCIFNNLLAPLFAEGLVSSDCFVYLVSQAPKLVFDYMNYACQNILVDGFELPLCKVKLLSIWEQKHGGQLVNKLSIVPPFHYSYECSFELLANYVYVFVFRYLICGVIEPLLVIVLKMFVASRRNFVEVGTQPTVNTPANTEDKRNSSRINSHSSISALTPSWLQVQKVSPLNQVVPILWRLHVSVKYMEDTVQSRQSINSEERDSEVENSNALAFLVVLDGDSLCSMEKWLSEKGKMKRKVVLRVVTDFSLLLAFGILCPPLAFIICLSIAKDCLEIRLALGRLLHITDLIKGASVALVNGDDSVRNSRSTMCDRINTVHQHLEQEVLDARDVIFDGIWYSLCVAVWIWAFVLFDTLSPAVGIGNSVAMVVLMLLTPYLCRYCYSTMLILFTPVNTDNWNSNEADKTVSNEAYEIKNVMIEMSSVK